LPELRSAAAAAGVEISLVAEGTLVADGTEQTVVEVAESKKPIRIYGWISLDNMDTGDQVTIYVYVKVKSGGSYIRHAIEQFADAQEKPAVYFVDRVVQYGFKVTLQQTAGTYRSFDYIFWKEESA